MKSKLALLLILLVAMGLGAVSIRQSRKLSAGKRELATLQRTVQRADDQVQELRASKEYINAQRQRLEEQARAQASQQTQALSSKAGVVPAGSTLTPAERSKPSSIGEGFGSMFAKMMEDPDTRKFIREQQRVVLDQLYAPLIKQLNMTPDEADRFKDLLADNSMKGAEKATSLFGSSATGTNRTDTLANMVTEHKAGEDQMKELLGEGRYSQYKEYQQTAGDRLLLTQFKQQLSGDAALSDQQSERLLSLIQEEKRAVAAVGQPLPGIDQDPSQINTVLSQDGTEQLLMTQESVNQRVYTRAEGMLSPNQLAAFGKFQTNQIQMMRMGMTMARKFLSPPETPANSAP